MIGTKKLITFKGVIQKKTKNHMVKRTRIFHSQLLGLISNNQTNQANTYSKNIFSLLFGRMRKNRIMSKKIRFEGSQVLPGQTELFRHQISRTRAQRVKKRILLPNLPFTRKKKIVAGLLRNSRNSFRVAFQKVAGTTRAVSVKNYLLQPKLRLPAVLPGKKNRLHAFLGKKNKLPKIFPLWKRLLYQLKRKKVLWGKWRTRKYYRVRRKIKQPTGITTGRFPKQKSLANKKSFQPRYSTISPQQSKETRLKQKSYRLFRTKYALFQEKNRKKVEILTKSSKKKTSNSWGKQKRPRKKRRHQFRRVNRLRPSVAARRRLRRKSRRFVVYADQYTGVAARRFYLQLKTGQTLYQKHRFSVGKHLWWLRSNLSQYRRGTVLDENPVSFRRLVISGNKNKTKRVGQKVSIRGAIYRFLQTNDNLGILPTLTQIQSRGQMKATNERKNIQGTNNKNISTSSLLPRKKLSGAKPLQTDLSRRLFSSVSASQATKIFARPKKLEAKGNNRLRKQRNLVKTKSKKLSTPQLSKKRKGNLKKRRLVFGRLTGKTSVKKTKFLAKKKRSGVNGFRPRRRRRVVHKNWTFRFPRWKIYYRNLWRYEKQNEKYKWLHADLFPGRKYRWIQQTYRNRHPRKEKKNKWLQRLTFQNQSYSLRKRKSRLISRLMHAKLFAKFYGPFNKKPRQWRKITPKTTTRKSLALSWYDHRLDITVYRIGLAPSLKVAQILIVRGYIFVNGSQKKNIEGRVEPYDVVAITPYAHLKENFEWYWFIRNQYRRYAFKRKQSQYKNVHAQRLAYPFGFRSRHLSESDLPRRDRIQGKEFERLLLGKGKPW